MTDSAKCKLFKNIVFSRELPFDVKSCTTHQLFFLILAKIHIT